MKQRELYPKTLDDPNGPLRDVVYCLDCYGIAVCGPMPSMHYLRSYQSCFQGRTGLTQRRFRPAGILLAPAGIPKGLVLNQIRIGRDRGDGVCVWRLGQ